MDNRQNVDSPVLCDIGGRQAALHAALCPCRCANVNFKRQLSRSWTWKDNWWGWFPGELRKIRQGRIASLRNVAICPECRLPPGPVKDKSLYKYHAGLGRSTSGRKSDVLGLWCDQLVQALPLGDDAHQVGMLPDNHARMLDPRYASRSHMKEWLRQCEHEHPACRDLEKRVMSGISKPRRLINVRTMCVEEGIPSDARYFALSYVWGDITRRHPSSESIQALSRPGSLLEDSGNRLHRVVRDAITLTTELGETYLWVDSLCICQDNPIEKRAEMAKMNHIYKGATMTIVALGSSDADEPLHGVHWCDPPRRQATTTVDGMRLVAVDPPVSVLAEASDCAWGVRAWTTQERLLSRRRLYMAPQQAYFSCLTAQYSEDRHEGESEKNAFYDSVETNLLAPVPRRRWWTPLSQYIISSFVYRPAGCSRAWDAWKQCTELYSGRVSSFPVDRYNAFRGVLNEQEERWRTHTIGGLPRNNLPQALYWDHGPDTLSFSANNVNRIECYPSWSWLGWSGQVSFTNCGREYFSPELRRITVWSGRRAFDLQYTCNMRYEVNETTKRSFLNRHKSPILPNSEDPLASVELSETHEKPMLVFDALHASMSVVKSSAVQGRLDIVEGEYRAGTLSCPSDIGDSPTDGSRMATLILVGKSRRQYLFFTRSGYRMAREWGAEGACFWLIVLVFYLVWLLPSIDIWFLRERSSVWAKLYTIGLPCGYLGLFVLYFLLNVDITAQVIWIEEIEGDLYERRGLGEMSMRAFKRAKPKKKTIKLV